jgi:hypothetical protein
VKLKTAQQIIDGFDAHIARKHKGRKEVTVQQNTEAKVAYLQNHLGAYYDAGKKSVQKG